MSKLWVLFVVLPLLVMHELTCFASEAESEWPSRARRGVVFIRATFTSPGGATSPAYGAALVVGVTNTSVTLATVLHVVQQDGVPGQDPVVIFPTQTVPLDLSKSLRVDNSLQIAFLTVTVSEDLSRTLDFRFHVASEDMVRTMECAGEGCRLEAVLISRGEDGLHQIQHIRSGAPKWGATLIELPTDVARPGQSGGAMFDATGRLIGLLQYNDRTTMATRFDLVRSSLREYLINDPNADNRIDGVSVLRVTGAPSGAQLVVDNEPVVDAVPNNFLSPGAHSVAVRAKDREESPAARVALADFQVVTCHVQLASSTTRLRAQTRWWVLAAGAMVATVGGVILWSAANERDAFWRSPSHAAYDRFDTLNTAGSWTLYAGGALLAAGAAWAWSGQALRHSKAPECAANNTNR